MKSHFINPRADKAEKLEAIGLSFHNWDQYWKENRYYSFSAAEVDQIEEATEVLAQACENAVETVVNNPVLMDRMAIPKQFHEAIGQSWSRKDPSLYGRFDLAFDGTAAPKMLEYNADTPTSLLESAVAQWYWMEDLFAGKDQFNSLHEKLIERWKEVLKPGTNLRIASLSENEEDWVCTHYLLETAVQAGFTNAKHMFIEDIGWDSRTSQFVDVDNQAIGALFKLYPWEWMLEEEFAAHVPGSSTQFIEPLWKTVLSNKAILAILWEKFKNNPNVSQYLLPAFIGEPVGLNHYAKKPIFSREGADVSLHSFGQVTAQGFEQGYGAEGYVYQQLVNMPCFDGFYPVIGSWVVGRQAAGMCIREDVKPITTNMSNFIPHIFS